MVRTTVGQALGVGILTIVTAISVAQTACAADSENETAKDASSSDKSPTAKKDKVLSGRLPAHYAKVVNQEQRAKIYAIQAEFKAKIAAAREALEKLTKEQDGQITALLTPEQKKLIEEAAGKSKKKKTVTGGKKEPQEPPAASESESTQPDAAEQSRDEDKNSAP
jgi:Spy/CpxP family protein refolding chaperone